MISRATAMSIWNINGLRAMLKKGDLLKYLTSNELDIICLNEIRIDEEKLQSISLPNQISLKYPYQYWNCSNEKKGYAGVSILSKFKPLNIFYNFITNETELKEKEGRILTLEYNSFYLICVYSPMSGLQLARLKERIDIWEKNLYDHISQLKKSKNIIFCGDLNVAHNEIDIINARKNTGKAGFTNEERKSLSNLLNSGMSDCFRKLYPNKVEYSWWSPYDKTARIRNRGWRLDYFIVNNNLWNLVNNCIIRKDVLGSDHCPVELHINLKNNDFN